MSAVKNYNINHVSQSLCGIIIESGYGEDTAIEVVQESDNFGDKTGADGETVRWSINDARVTVTFTLMQTSDENAKLSALANLDLALPGGAGVGPYSLKDNNGTTVILLSAAWVAKPPDIEFGKEVKERKWKIRGVLAARLDGGN